MSPLKIIHVEDSATDSELIIRQLKTGAWQCEVNRVETEGELLRALDTGGCDLILSDCTLPQFHGLEALRIAHGHSPEIPFIFVSGTIGEEVAIKTLQEGATDYILKDRLARLVPAVQRALDEAASRKVRAEAEGQLRQARKLETLGTLAGGLAHDFRNILQILKLNISLLPMEAGNPEQVHRVAAQLDKATDRGTALVQELLVFARRTDANLAQVDLGQVATETMQLIAEGLPPGITLSLQVPHRLPPMLGDAGQLDRVLTNLILNARDAMPNGGAIEVSVDTIRFQDTSSSLWKIRDTPYLRVTVADSGTGMDEATQARIFEPFYTTKSAGKGTGLGLSVVFGLMESHQGFIDLASAPGHGTTFTLFFPVCAEAAGDLGGVTEIAPPKRLLGQPAGTSDS